MSSDLVWTGDAPPPQPPAPEATCDVCHLVHAGPHPTHAHRQASIVAPCPDCGQVDHLRLQLGASPEPLDVLLAAAGLDDPPPELRRHHPGVYFRPR